MPLLFRIIPSHPDDHGKARIRIPREQMKLLGLASGDIVNVIGFRRTAATCLPLDGKHLDFDPEFEFVDDACDSMPVARLSDVVSKNVMGRTRPSLVQVQRADVTGSRRVVLGTRTVLDYANAVKMENTIGMILTKGDRVQIPNAIGCGYSEFLVIDTWPRGESNLVSDTTLVELSTNTPELSDLSRPPSLRGTIDIHRQVLSRSLGVMLESLDYYEDGSRIFLRIGHIFDDPTDWLGSRINMVAFASDNLGNQYSCTDVHEEGSEWSIGRPQYRRLSISMEPALDEDASEITIVLKEISWQMREKKDVQSLDNIESALRHERAVVSIWQARKSFQMIASGPWEFSISLKNRIASDALPAIS